MPALKEYLLQPRSLLMAALKKGNRFSPDKTYLRILYFLKMNRILRLKHPRTFNEKLQWLKIHDRNPDYTRMVDKVTAKEHVEAIAGPEIIIPTLGVWDTFDDIDFGLLPNRFALKTNHSGGSSGVIICKDKSTFDKDDAKKRLTNSLNDRIFPRWREWPYKNIRPCIFAEKYIGDSFGETQDYKLMCFNGEVKCSFVCTERRSETGLKLDFFDREWVKMPFDRHYPSSNKNIPAPKSYEEMVKIAEKLSAGIPFVRIDFYEVDDKPYFGEMTFYPGSGMEEFTPEEWDYELGSWIKLASDKPAYE